MRHVVWDAAAGGVGAMVNVSAVAMSLAELMRRFDADPLCGADLGEADRLGMALTIAQGGAAALCSALATETAAIVAGYPGLPAAVVDDLGGHLIRLGNHWPTSAVAAESSDVAVSIVRAALHGDQVGLNAALGRVIAVGDERVQLHCLQCVFAACCTVVAAAQGY